MPTAAPQRVLAGPPGRGRQTRAPSYPDFTPATAPRPGAGSTAGNAAAIAGIALTCVLSGALVAVAGLNALYLCIALVICAFILRDFRIGVVLLILLMPVSRSSVFPHAMLGITGLNPLNVLLVATTVACLVQALTSGTLRRLLPAPLWWLYIVPLLVAGTLGVQHVNDIAPGFIRYNIIDFSDTSGYLLELVFK